MSAVVSKAVILVGSKSDLVRSRTITADGKEAMGKDRVLPGLWYPLSNGAKELIRRSRSALKDIGGHE